MRWLGSKNKDSFVPVVTEEPGEWRWEIAWNCVACGFVTRENPYMPSISKDICEECGSVGSFVVMKRRGRYVYIKTYLKNGAYHIDSRHEYDALVGL